MTVRVWDLANGTQVLYNVDQLEFSKSSPPSPSLLSPSVANIVLTPPPWGKYNYVQNIHFFQNQVRSLCVDSPPMSLSLFSTSRLNIFHITSQVFSLFTLLTEGDLFKNRQISFLFSLQFWIELNLRRTNAQAALQGQGLFPQEKNCSYFLSLNIYIAISQFWHHNFTISIFTILTSHDQAALRGQGGPSEFPQPWVWGLHAFAASS